jgi:hypothetical protein
MNLANELIFAGLIPLAVAAAVALGLRLLRARPAAVWASGVAAGFVAGMFSITSRSGFGWGVQSVFSPREASHWLSHAALLAAGVSILTAYLPRHRRVWAVALAGLLALAVPVRLLAGPMAQRWSILEKFSHLALWAAALALVWMLLATARNDDTRDPISGSRLSPSGSRLSTLISQLLLILVALAAAVVITLSGSFSLGRFCGALAAALAGTAIVSPRGLGGAAGVVSCSLGGIILLGVFYAQLSAMNAATLMAALIAAAARMPDFAGTQPTWLQVALRAAACIGLLAIALVTSLP